MSDDDQLQAKIDELREPPTIPATRADGIRHAVGYVGLAIGTAALVVAIGAGVRGSQTADCINANQGARNQPNVADRQATDDLFKKQTKALNVISTNPGGAIADIQKAFAAYTVTRDADDKARDANPIGKC